MEFGSTQIAVTTVQAILIISNIAGNSLVCFIIFKNQDMRNSVNYLLVNLAVADMMVATFLAIQHIFIQTFTHPDGVTGVVLCKLLTDGFFGWVGAGASIVTLVAIAVERYYAVLHPFGNMDGLSNRKLKVIICCSWIFGVIMNIPWFLHETFDEKKGVCTYRFPEKWMDVAYAWTWLLLMAILPVSLMLALYSRVVHALWFKGTEVTEGSNLQQGVMMLRKRVTVMAITVSIIFGVCWLTDTICYMVFFYTSKLPFGDAHFTITNTLILLNSAVNPTVYALVNQRFRQKMKLMMRCCCRRSRIHPSRKLQSTQRVNRTTHPTQEREESSKL